MTDKSKGSTDEPEYAKDFKGLVDTFLKSKTFIEGRESSRAEEARKHESKYAESFLKWAESEGLTKEEAEREKPRLFKSYLETQAATEQGEAAKYFKDNIAEIVKDEKVKKGLEGLLGSDEKAKVLLELAGDDDSARDKIYKYLQFVQFKKSLKDLKENKDKLVPTGTNPSDEGRVALSNVPREYQERVMKEIPEIAYEEVINKLRKEKPHQPEGVLESWAKLSAYIAQIKPKYNQVKEAVERVLKVAEKEHSGEEGKSRLDSVYGVFSKIMQREAESGNNARESLASELVYSAYTGKKLPRQMTFDDVYKK